MAQKKKARTSDIYSHYAIALIIVAFGLALLALPSGTDLTGLATSQVGNLTAGIQSLISCTWSNEALAVSFGSSLNPGDNNINATQNYGLWTNSSLNGTLYNVTVDTLSNVQANITIRGADLISGSNLIGVGNVSWASNTTAANGTNMVAGSSTVLNTTFNTATQVASNEPIGSTVWFRFWLDIPSGQVAGTYTGNYTQQCQQAS